MSLIAETIIFQSPQFAFSSNSRFGLAGPFSANPAPLGSRQRPKVDL
jgi:hypothetical protein